MPVHGQHRLLIVDDHAILRAGLIALLATKPEFAVVGEAADGQEAIQLAEKLQPDLVLLDLSIPKISGMEAMKDIKRVSEKSRILVLTAHKSEDHVFTALQSGANGYLLKDSAADEFFLAIKTVLSGEHYIAAGIATTVVNGYLGGRAKQEHYSVLDKLSTQEREVLRLVAEGHKSWEIASFLCISVKMVEKSRVSLMQRLNLHGVPALTSYAIEKGLISK